MIVIFVVFISTLFLLRIYTANIDGNIYSAPFCVLKVHNTIFQISKVHYLLWTLFYKTHGYFLYRNYCCAGAFVRWVADVVSTFIHTDITVMSFRSLIMTCIHSFLIFRRTQSIFLALIIIRTWSIFIFVCFIVAHTRYINAFGFFLVHRSNYRLNFSIYIPPEQLLI